MKLFKELTIYTLFFVIVVTHTENKYSSNQTDGCEKDSTQQHCLKKDHPMEGDGDDDEPVFYEDDDDVTEEAAQKWKGRQALFQWDPVKVFVLFLWPVSSVGKAFNLIIV